MASVGFTRSLLAATALVGVTAAHAQTNYVIPNPPAAGASVISGGGSSLATPTYIQLFTFYSPNDGTIALNFSSKGSGNSQCAFLVDTSVPATTITGAQSFNTAASATQHVDIAASDATLSATQIDIYNNGYAASRDGATSTCSFTTQTLGTVPPVAYPTVAPRTLGGPIIQLPTFGTPITIPFNVTGVRNTATSVKLTDDMLCGIFSGQITLFSDSRLAGSGLLNASTTGQTIHPVVRSDGSGTSFLLLQHLIGNTAAYPAAVPGVCTPSNSNFNIGAVFPPAPGNTFATASTTFANAFASKTLPSNFISGSGSGGVQSAVLNNANTLGYLSPDFTKAASINSGASVPFVAQVRNDNNNTFYQPTFTNTRLALGTGAVPAPNSLTDPGTLAVPQAYVPTVNNPSTGYPIVGYTTIEIPQCFADNQLATGLYTFLGTAYTDINATSIQSLNGFSPLPTNLFGVINNYILNPSSYNLEIQSAAVCQGAGASGAGTFVGR